MPDCDLCGVEKQFINGTYGHCKCCKCGLCYSPPSKEEAKEEQNVVDKKD
jgi:hypothetical protein